MRIAALFLFLSSLAFGDVYVNKQSFDISNLSLTASVATNALTVAVKTKEGVNATTGNAIILKQRSSTATVGQFYQRQITAALSIVVPSGATIGTVSSVDESIFVYIQDNSGSQQACISVAGFFDDGTIQTSTAISGSSSSRTTLYCTSAITGPVRLVGRLVSNVPSAGTWSSAPSAVSVSAFKQDGVQTASSSQQKIEWAYIVSAAVSASSSSWISSVSHPSTGVYNLNLAGGAFSSSPGCTATPQTNAVTVWLINGGTSTSLVNVSFNNASGFAAVDRDFYVICMGQR